MVGTAGRTVIPQLEGIVYAEVSVESCTTKEKLKLPAVVGVPLNIPVVSSSVRPPGGVPPVISTRYGGIPPMTLKPTEYGLPTVPPVAGQFTVSGRGRTRIEQDSVVAVFRAASVTLIWNAYVPIRVGVPVISPVSAFSTSPGGSAPELTTKVNGAVPPVRLTLEL